MTIGVPNSGARPVATDLTGNHFDGKAISLVDLHRVWLKNGQAMISNVTFNNCRIEGPAVMLVTGGCDFNAVDFGWTNGDIANLVLRPASPTSVTGAIPVQDCKFIGVEFFAVGFTGPAAFLDQLLAVGEKP